ncbi:MAG: hypothetical protein ACXW5H_14685 [Thermoanaerobaculia bacterium]
MGWDETPKNEGLTPPAPTRLIESGVGFLHQLAANLPPDAKEAETPRRRIEPRHDADGSMFLAVPLPSHDAVAQIVEGLAALLRSVQR